MQHMGQAIDVIFRRHSAAYRHSYEERLQLLDVDMTGMPCGPNQEGSRKGYFGENNIRYGRQLGRMMFLLTLIFADRNLQTHPCASLAES